MTMPRYTLRNLMFLGLVAGPTSVGTGILYEIHDVTDPTGIGRSPPRYAVIESIEGAEITNSRDDARRDGELEFIRNRTSGGRMMGSRARVGEASTRGSRAR